jgi:hypothetical protein
VKLDAAEAEAVSVQVAPASSEVAASEVVGEPCPEALRPTARQGVAVVHETDVSRSWALVAASVSSDQSIPPSVLRSSSVGTLP